MIILTRIARLFKADIHGILDGLEEPETILKQAIRDMQAEIDKALATLDALTLKQERLQEKHQHLLAFIQELQTQLHFCLTENNDVLAKSVIRKKIQGEFSLQEVARQLKQISDERVLKLKETDERKEKLQAIRDKLALFTDATELENPLSVADASTLITQDDIELAFLFEKKRYSKASFKGDQS